MSRIFSTSAQDRGKHETIWFWWNRFDPIFAAEIRKRRPGRMRALSGWRWHLDGSGADRIVGAIRLGVRRGDAAYAAMT